MSSRNRIWMTLFICSALGVYGQHNGAIIGLQGHAGPAYAPAVSGDGRHLVFQGSDKTYKSWQLFESTWENGKWRAPVPIDSVNSRSVVPTAENQFQADFIGTPCLNFRGDTLYFSATFREGSGGKDIFFSVRTGETWRAPQPLSRNVNTPSNEESPSVSADGRALYFTRPVGAKDDMKCFRIYVSRRGAGGEWGRAVALPSVVNDGCVKAPRIQSDNVTLLFSARKPGNEGFDLYKSVLDMTGNWTSPQVITEMNTAGSTLYAQVNASRGSVTFNTAMGGAAAIREYSPIPAVLTLQKYFKVRCEAFDSLSGRRVAADVKLILEREDQVLLQEWKGTEKVETTLYGSGKFRLVVSSPGYRTKSVRVGLSPASSSDIDLTVKLARNEAASEASNHSRRLFAPKESQASAAGLGEDKPIDVPVYFSAGDATGKAANVEKTLNQRTNVVLEGITFQSGSYQLQKRAVDDLALIVNYLKQNPQSAIEVVAHTDDVGDTAENQLLSEKRAEAVRKFLVDSKIDGSRVTTRGMGETVPVFPNTTDENRAKNRRVEFRLI